MKIPQREGEGKTWRMNKRQDVELALRRSGGSQSQKKGIPLIIINEGKRTSHEKKLIGAHRRAAGKSFSKVQGWHNAIKTRLARRHPPHPRSPRVIKRASSKTAINGTDLYELILAHILKIHQFLENSILSKPDLKLKSFSMELTCCRQGLNSRPPVQNYMIQFARREEEREGGVCIGQ